MHQQMPDQMYQQMPDQMYRQTPEPMQRNMNINQPIRSRNPVQEMRLSNKSVINTKNPFSKKINPPTGVDEILADLKSNTDNISDIMSGGSDNRKINIRKGRRKKKSITLNLNE